MDLILPVKRKWFERIRDGLKDEEFRLVTPYWRRRLEGKTFEHVIITLGYPPRHDTSRRLVFPWQGYRMTTITSEEWNNEPRHVFAINLR